MHKIPLVFCSGSLCTYEHSTDEASYCRPIREQDNGSESSDEDRPSYDRKHDINQRAVTLRQHSPVNHPIHIRTLQRSHLYILSKQTLPQIFPTGTDLPTCDTHSLPSTSKVNNSTKNSHHLKSSTYSQQQNERRRNQPSCLRTNKK
ncbi:hypothetical protein FHG87_003486 [Trinorchestia longiramus]|nr:hypothetical protein FHG87_003486 [Trinorchestia longiramus]